MDGSTMQHIHIASSSHMGPATQPHAAPPSAHRVCRSVALFLVDRARPPRVPAPSRPRLASPRPALAARAARAAPPGPRGPRFRASKPRQRRRRAAPGAIAKPIGEPPRACGCFGARLCVFCVPPAAAPAARNKEPPPQREPRGRFDVWRV
ncbi:MAG: hypothetical protein J3K34DRAFT_404575 [Monoraphidium minutum]|nr:MAG: hypothetical protein J3K34DRAFT_404575 [Monoraphidium minutum]